MTYRHGVYASEVPTSIVPPARVSAGIPVVFGTAPVHLAETVGNVNKPVLCYSYAEAVQQLGYGATWSDWTLCEFMKAFFVLFNVAPAIFVNVFDPAVHKTGVTDEEKAVANDRVTLDHAGLVADPVVKNTAGVTTFTKDTDYTVDRATGVIARIVTGAMAADEGIKISYDYADPAKVTPADIIGGVDGGTGALSGLELLNQVYPMFGLVPGQVVAPGWSHDPGVAAVMHAKSGSINGIFKAISIVDIDSGTVNRYTDVPSVKNTNNLTDEQLLVCWPKAKLGDDEFWKSSQLAGLICRTDSENDDIPYASSSNKNYQMSSCVANGEEIWLGLEQANYLNGQGVITALNFVGGWKSWGNRTGAYPGVTDVKDTFYMVRRMFNWIANSLILTFWQKVDFPTNRRLIETIVDSGNIWLNGLAARQYILGGRVEFQADENPVTDVMDGIINFHVYVTPPSPAREIGFILEYDPAYISSLFG
ncbi:MAG: hypothetical protein MI862_05395 [Desulfobacterales bacterium]|nr:hypothetical protein [Desulfobacterales bacterium]